MHGRSFTNAKREIERLEKSSVYAQARSFRDVIDVHRAAVVRVDRTLGFSLGMSWGSMYLLESKR